MDFEFASFEILFRKLGQIFEQGLFPNPHEILAIEAKILKI
jgi:hypothetical protein